MTLTAKERKMRNATKNALLQEIEKKELKQQFYIDQVDLYMQFYDHLLQINKQIVSDFDADLVKEKRLVSKEMRSILSFLNLKPDIVGGDIFDEELE